MNVAFFGYREWAYKIFQNLVKIKSPLWKFTDVSKADVVLYYGWSWMIPKEMYDSKLCLILHTSPLPKYRGGSPLQNQIINGEKMSAATILKVAKEVDTGEIYAQSQFSLEGTLKDIFERIVEVGTRDTIDVLNNLAQNTAKPLKQIEYKATYFNRRKPEESEITLRDIKHKTAKELYNFIRALADPYPNAYIVCKDGKKLYLTGALLESQEESVTKP